MKILFVIPSLAKGGQEKAGMILTNYLRQFHDVTVVCFEEKNCADFNYESDIVRILPSWRYGLIKKPVSGFQKIIKLKKLKRTLNPDVSIAFGNSAIILNWLADCGDKKISAIRQSFTGIINNKSASLKLHKSLYVRALKKSQKIIPVSSSINTELKEYFNIPNDIFINNGYNIEEINKSAAEDIPSFKNDRLWLIHSGRFDICKGHWHLIKIFAEIKKTFPEAGLILLGSVDESDSGGASILNYCKKYAEKNHLRWSAGENNFEADIIFAGHQKAPFKFIKRSHLFLLTSLWEGFPNALVEAMACGIPVAAADCPTGPKEILVNNETGEEYGLLLPPLDGSFNNFSFLTDATDLFWAEKIRDLLEDKVKIESYKKQSAKRASHYSVEKMGNKWLKVIEEL